MTLFHAVAFIDHQSAQVLQFDAEHTVEQEVHSHLHYTRQHGSAVRSEHEFFAEVCEALADVAQVLVTGGHQGLSDFRHYLGKHSPQTAARITGYEVVDHPSNKVLVALARKHFVKYNLMTGTPSGQ